MDSNTHEVLSDTAGEMRPEADEAKTTGAKLTAQQWAELEAAYHAGATAKEVGARFGVSAQRVYNHVGASGKLAQRRHTANDRYSSKTDVDLHGLWLSRPGP